MSSFARGRGITTPRSPQSSSPTDTRNGIGNIKPSNSHPTVELPKYGQPLYPPLPPYEKSKVPNLHVFGETLIALKEEDSLFPLIVNIINDPNCKEETVHRMVQIIVDRCLWLPMVSRKFAGLLSFLSSHKVFGRNIRYDTFNALQEFFENRELFRTSKQYGDNTFRNVVQLTGEIYYRYRGRNKRYAILGSALLEYMSMLAKSIDVNDLFILTQQLSWTRDDIKNLDQNSVNKLMLEIRNSIIMNGAVISDVERCYLLLCLDLYSEQFDNLSMDTKSFYTSFLGDDVISSLKPPSLEMDDHIEYYKSINKYFS